MNTIMRRLLLPALALLVLMPLVSGLVFHVAGRNIAQRKAERELITLQETLLPLAEEAFHGGEENALGAFFALAESHFPKSHSRAQLLMLNQRGELVYPRSAEQRSALKPLADGFGDILAKHSLPETVTVELVGQGSFLLRAEAVEEINQRYTLIAFCSAAQIGDWVGSATLVVMGLAAGFGLALFLCLFLSARSVVKPLFRVSATAARMADGHLVPLETPLSLQEPEALRQAINSMAGELERAEVSQKSLLHSISHELRNPLKAMADSALSLEQDTSPDPKATAHGIYTESQRLSGVVNGLVTLTRMDSVANRSVLDPVSLTECAEEILDKVNSQALQRNITLILKARDSALRAMGSEALVKQVLENLLTNAIRYARTTVILSITEKQDRAVLSVTDDGEGISELDFPHLFERGYKGKDGNLGIGLAIAQSAAERMNGTLTAENRLEGGARFTLKLLLAK